MRRIYFNLFSITLFLLVISSCKKDIVKPGTGTAALTIVNCVAGNSKLLTNFNGTDLSGVKFYGQLNYVDPEWYLFTTNYSGQQKLGLYLAADTSLNSNPLFNLKLNLPVNTMHTLFLMGTPQAPDTLFTKNKLPYHLPADSTMGIRFVNISEGGNPVSVNLIGQADRYAIANLPYKGATEFKHYTVRSTVDSYTFEFRDRITDELLGSYTFDEVNASGSVETGGNKWRNNNFTLALFGTQANKQVLMVMEYFR
ncbi:MAG: hypothetical protein WC623_18535 [Pedobacter sp.]|uniref:hypothetical protein n=1 Tax=Pedobacter sp. TaxID=1411316 RepID=UPI0035654453